MLKLTARRRSRSFEDILQLYPDELFAFQVEYPADYLAKWDAETTTRRLTGVAANDCHHNMVLLVKMVDAATREGRHERGSGRRDAVDLRGAPPGNPRADAEAINPETSWRGVDLDPYHRSFRNVSTHVLAPELTEPAIRERPPRRACLRQPRLDVRPDRVFLRTDCRQRRILGQSHDHG